MKVRKNIKSAQIILIIIALTLSMLSGIAQSSERINAVVFLNDNITYKSIKPALKKLNIKANIFSAPNVIYLKGSSDNIKLLKENNMVKEVSFSGEKAVGQKYSDIELSGLKFLSYQQERNSREVVNSYGAENKFRQPPAQVKRHSKRTQDAKITPTTNSATTGLPDDFYFTSEYMIGDIAVAIVLPESDGTEMLSTEDWDSARMDAVVNEIMAALAWWSDRYEGANKNLTFHVKQYLQVPTKYEIISMTAWDPLSDEAAWMDDIFTNLGYTNDIYPTSEYDYIDKAFAFNNNLRAGVEDSSIDTDWAITFLIIDSFNDDDGLFLKNPNEFFAYSFLGGPVSILTYDNGNYTIDKMREVALHEMAHQFYALDEYYTGYEPCTTRTGYLAFDNQNSEFTEGSACISNEICVMRDLGRATFPYNSGLLCWYSRGQIGWYDDDRDYIYEPVDTIPSLTTTGYEKGVHEIAGTATTSEAVNQNPLSYPKGVERINVTVNKIVSLMYRLDQGEWADILPLDGDLGDATEQFVFEPKANQTGTYTLEIKATNTEGNSVTVLIENVYISVSARSSAASLFSCYISEAAFCESEKSTNVLSEIITWIKSLIY